MGVSDRRLLEMQANALFTHDAGGRIRRINEPGGGPAPRFFFGCTRQGNLWRFRYDLPADIVQRVEELAAREPVSDALCIEPRTLTAFQAALGDGNARQPVHSGPAYRFPYQLAAPRRVRRITPANVHLVEAMGQGWEGFGRDLAQCEPCWAVIEDDLAVSVCFSARRTQHVAEAGVETRQTSRGQGYAASAVSAWARTVRAMNRIPLYSTSWENAASQSVAHKLGLMQYGVDLSLC